MTTEHNQKFKNKIIELENLKEIYKDDITMFFLYQSKLNAVEELYKILVE